MSNPIFAFLAFTGGSFEGAIIRDMHLANALHRRGFKVVVYWLMQTNPDLVDPGITQRVLFRGGRYMWAKPNATLKNQRLDECHRRLPAGAIHPATSHLVNAPLRNFVKCMCDGWTDIALVKHSNQ